MAKKTKRLDKKGETPSRLELTQEEQRLLRRVQTAYPGRSLYEAFSLFEKERDYKMSPALKRYVKTKKGDSKKYGVGMMSGGMAKKPMNKGMAALKKAAPAVAKKMGYKHGGKVHKTGYNKGGMAKCGASYKG
jgi:hypothetical protein